MQEETIQQVGFEHSWIFMLSLLALYFYFKGSYKLFYNQNDYFQWLGLGVLTDIAMAVIASTKFLPVLLPGENIPYTSILFLMHMIMAGVGLIGYTAIILVIVTRGIRKKYPYIKVVAYRILLPVWIVGVIIALINFLSKAIFRTNLYEFL